MLTILFFCASGDKYNFTFSGHEGLLVISCSVAALIQTYKIHMPHFASGRDGILLCWYRSGV